jgi:hypothetical protein
MTREGKTEIIGQVLNMVVNDSMRSQLKESAPYLPISKKYMWLRFIETFKDLNGKKLD